ncbi:CotH kinase family protein [Bacteroidota bacterium]
MNLNISFLRLFFLLLMLSGYSKAASQVLITEVCSSNSSLLTDPDYGSYGDWIELYNNQSEWINIGAWSLSDDSTDLARWRFPEETYIGPHAYKIIFADGKGSKLHTNFKLDKAGEWLALIDSEGNLKDSLSIPYLHNDMSYGRMPGSQTVYSVFVSPTPGKENTGIVRVRIAAPVSFSQPGGFYSGSQKIALGYPNPESDIHYTMDGSYPNRNSPLYNDSIEIRKTSVIRAICFEEGTIAGNAATQTYFIDEPQNLPIFSMVTDSVHLFSDEFGIMVKGTAGTPGYCSSLPYNLNQDWERPVNLEFYEMEGKQVLNQICGTKIYGGCSRIRYPQKSFAFFARNSYESSSFSYPIFPEKPAEEYESFILRASADDQPKTLFRDPLTQMLVKDVIDVDYQAYRPVVLYINGDYYGIINLREKINEHYPANNYDLDPDLVSMLRRNPESSWNIIAGSSDHYNAMMDYIAGRSLADDDAYAYVKSQMDMDEYINYQIIQIFSGARDWPGNNIKFWRSEEEPYTRWRWVLYDLDHHTNDPVGDIMEEATEVDCDCSWPNPPWSTLLFRSLLENASFKQEFVQRFSTYTNTHFSRERYHRMINELQAAIAPEIPRHIERWGEQKVEDPDNTWMQPIFNSIEQWDDNIQVMHDFVELRHEIAIQQVNYHLGIEGTKKLVLSNTDSTASSLLLNNNPVYDSLFQGNFSKGSSMTIRADVEEGFKLAQWELLDYTAVNELLIIEGDNWKYNDSGSGVDGNWLYEDYDDSWWSTGNAELGYGDGDEATIVNYGGDASNKYITTYFRKQFTIDSIDLYEVYQLRVKRDDAVIIFLNGRQIIRENMPQWGYGHLATAEKTINGDEEDRFLYYNINPTFFKEGENILCAEIHQAGAGSSDISFDLELTAGKFVIGERTFTNSESVHILLNEHKGLVAHIEIDTNRVRNVFINEVLASSKDLQIERLAGDDWIEFYNAGQHTIDMGGLFLSDTLPEIAAWQFPENRSELTSIAPGAFLLVTADNEFDDKTLHTNFRLSNRGENLTLFQKIGHDTIIIDQLQLQQQYQDISWGRYPDGSDSKFYMLHISPLNSNRYQPVIPYVADSLFINEIAANNIDKHMDEAGEFEDWIEIYNAGSLPIDLAGFYLADSLPFLNPWRFPLHMEMNTTVQPDSFLIIYADGEAEEGPLHANFRLNRNGEEIVLIHILAGDTTIIDQVTFGYQYNNVSWGRYPDGSENFEFMMQNTPWYSNNFIIDSNIPDNRSSQVIFYPNPAHDYLYIESDKPMERISIFNVTGTSIIEIPGHFLTSLQIEDLQLSHGMYFVVIRMSDSTSITGKLVVE